jgi:hypothetical protein
MATPFALSPLMGRLVGGALTATLTFALLPSPPGKPLCAEQMQVRLFFGLRTPDGPVSQVDWARFLTDVVTPRFPSGLTVVDATGQWRPHNHERITREPSRIVEIVHEDSRETDRRIQEVVTIYKRQYRQESVMLTRGRIEVCF